MSGLELVNDVYLQRAEKKSIISKSPVANADRNLQKGEERVYWTLVQYEGMEAEKMFQPQAFRIGKSVSREVYIDELSLPIPARSATRTSSASDCTSIFSMTRAR